MVLKARPVMETTARWFLELGKMQGLHTSSTPSCLYQQRFTQAIPTRFSPEAYEGIRRSPWIFFHLRFWIICQTTDFQNWKDWQTALLAAWSSSVLPSDAECSQINRCVFLAAVTLAEGSQAVHIGDKMTIWISLISSVKMVVWYEDWKTNWNLWNLHWCANEQELFALFFQIKRIIWHI